MEKGAIKLVVFHSEDFSYWKAHIMVNLLSQGRGVWEIVEADYERPDALEGVTPTKLQRYENNSHAMNTFYNALGRKEFNRISHLRIAYAIWNKLCDTYEGTLEIKSKCKDTYNQQYQIFAQKPGESLNEVFDRFELIVSNLRTCGPLAYSNNDHAKHLLYSLDENVWAIKITALEEITDFDSLDTDKLFSKLKSHKMSRKGHPSVDMSSSKALVSSHAKGSGGSCYVANPSFGGNTWDVALSCFVSSSNEQIEAIPYDELALLMNKF
jgi:hypothetical protein